MRALIFVAQGFFAQRAIQRDRQALQAILQYVVADALLDAIYGGFFAERPGHQKKRNIASRGAQIREGLDAAPAGQAIVGEHGVEGALLQQPAKIVSRFYKCRLDTKAGVAELEQNEFDVMLRMLDKKNAQRRGRVGERRFFENRRFHVRAPGSESRNAAVGGG